MQLNRLSLQPAPDNSGRILLYSLDEGERVSPFFVGMFKNNEIKGAAPFRVIEDNNGTRLEYLPKGDATLAMLMAQPQKRDRMLTVMANIGSVIADAEEYMLAENSFILESNYIFVNTHTLDVHLIYDPTYNRNGYSYRALIKMWALKANHDLSEDAMYPTEIIGIINEINADADAAVLQRKITELRDTAPKAPRQQNETAANTGLAAKMLGGIKLAAPAPSQNAPVKSAPAQNVPTQNVTAQTAPAQNAPAQTAPAQSNPIRFTPTAMRQAPVRSMNPDDNATVFANDMIQPETASPSVKKAFLVDMEGRRVYIDKPKFQIGKGRATATPNDLIISNPGVSRAHALIEHIDTEYYLVDLYSLNGTFINNERISSNERRRIINGDTITFANQQYYFCTE
ncbi:MAG: FHA domain-containing protein [Oscillospiraceae bacterium]